MFFYHARSEIIHLKPNEEVVYRLPPMSVSTSGTSILVQISQNSADDPPDPDNEPGTPHIDWYEAFDLSTVTLLHDNNVVTTKSESVVVRTAPLQKALQHSADSLFHDNHWRLRIRRGPSPLEETRRFRVIVRYPSQMPEIERNIPLRFFQKAFEEIWNGKDIITASLEGSNLVIKFREDFARLYDLENKTYPLPDFIKFEGITASVTLHMGAGPMPGGQEGSNNSVFLELRVNISRGKFKLVLPVFPDIEGGINLGPFDYLIIRLYLYLNDNGSLQFQAVIDREAGIFALINFFLLMLVDFDILNQKLQDKLDDIDKSITRLNGSAHFSVLDKYLKPFLVGGFHEIGDGPFRLIRMRYEEGSGDTSNSEGIIDYATGDLVVTFPGRREANPPGTANNSDDTDDPNSLRGWLMLNGLDATQGIRAIMSAFSVSSIRQLLNSGSIPLFRNTRMEEQIIIFPTDKSNIEHVPIPSDSQMEWLSKIDHIVVLMQENRSFDQVLGYLSRQGHRGYLRIDEVNDSNMVNDRVIGLAPEGHNDHSQQMNKFNNAPFLFFPQKAEIYLPQDPQKPSTWTSPTAWPSYSLSGPSHGSGAVEEQINGGEDGSPGGMKGFVTSFANKIGEPNFVHLRQVMDYYDANDLPVYGEIVRQFGICDRWFSSFAGGTQPNRFVSLTGKLNRDRFGNIEENNSNIKGGEFVPISTATLFDYLTLYGKTWRVYIHGYGTIRLFAKYTFDITNVISFNDQLLGFEKSAKEGTLPNVTWIEPDYIELPPGNDDHAPADMQAGQILVNRVIRALVNSSKWHKTLLIITYDEHGGFYDHVTPPPNDPPLGDSRLTKGPRVPAFVISPLVKPGQVFHNMFDHSSIGATILRRFCDPPPKVSDRLDKAIDLSRVLELADSPVIRVNFGDFGKAISDLDAFKLPRGRQINKSVDSILTNFDSNSKEEDFHWFLRVARLFTGSAGNPITFDFNSLRGWLMLNGLDATQGIRAIMSAFSVSSIRQLLKKHP
jgi:phospholipase C